MLTPRGVNPPISLMLSSSVAMALPAFLLYLMPARRGILAEVRQLHWASRLLPVSLVGLEVASLLVYRSGWNIRLAAILANVAASLIMVPVALFVFKDTLNWINLAGVVTCLAGVVMLNWKR
jgi:drug/metabolite transporter (DMT)-like permease